MTVDFYCKAMNLPGGGVGSLIRGEQTQASLFKPALCLLLQIIGATPRRASCLPRVLRSLVLIGAWPASTEQVGPVCRLAADTSHRLQLWVAASSKCSEEQGPTC